MHRARRPSNHRPRCHVSRPVALDQPGNAAPPVPTRRGRTACRIRPRSVGTPTAHGAVLATPIRRISTTERDGTHSASWCPYQASEVKGYRRPPPVHDPGSEAPGLLRGEAPHRRRRRSTVPGLDNADTGSWASVWSPRTAPRPTPSRPTAPPPPPGGGGPRGWGWLLNLNIITSLPVRAEI